MAVDTAKYRPLLFDERLSTRDIDKDGDQDLTLCRAACTAMAWDACTDGEWTKQPNGTVWGKGKISVALERMRVATGEPTRPGYNISHVDDFLRGIGAPPDAGQIYLRPFKDIKASLSNGWTVSMSGNTRHTPAGSPLRKYVNPVGHEMLLTRISGDGERIAFIDPMTPHGTQNYQRWALAGDFYKFGKEFRSSDGNYVTVRFKRGRYTQAREVARDRAAVILKLQQDLANLQQEWERQQKKLIAQDVQIVKLEADIARLTAELEAALATDVAALNAELDTIEAAVQRSRNILG